MVDADDANSYDAVAHFVIFRMNFCLCLACTHRTAYRRRQSRQLAIALLFGEVMPVDRIVGCRCANRRCHGLDSETVLCPGRIATMYLFLFLRFFFPSLQGSGPHLATRLVIRPAIRIRAVIRMRMRTYCAQPQPCRGFHVSCQRSCGPWTRFRTLR